MIDKKGMLEKMLMSDSKPDVMSADKDAGLKAKIDALKEMLMSLEAEIGGGIKSDMDGMKKVSVMAPDEGGLKEGLEMASQLAANKSGPMVDDVSATHPQTDDTEELGAESEKEIPAPKTDEESEDGEDTFASVRNRKPKW